MIEIVSPYAPRPQFEPFHERDQRWAVLVCHRRAGKTVACINDLIRGAAECDKPNPRFAYIAPLFNQAKDVAWSYVKQYTQCIPGTEFNESELRADLPGSSRLRLYGADNPDRLRGLYLDGVVLDEYADMDPRLWGEVIRPALSDRQGWAVFIGTPKGRNQFFDIWSDAGKDADWYRLMLKASESGLVAVSELADARKMMTEDQYAQEYECSFEAAILGAYFGREMVQAEKDRRIASVPWQPGHEVETAWDLGVRDSTAIWFVQRVGREVHLIDYYESSGVGLDHYVKVLREKPYAYGDAILPHDVTKTELGTGKTLLETLHGLGFTRTVVQPAHTVQDGINAARLLIPTCWFDADKCKRGIEALRQYRAEYDAELKAFRNKPLHDWTSHPADAFRYLAMHRPTNANFHRKLVYPKRGIA